MHSTEILFLIGFVVFIAAILILDMLVIDRKAHAVSIKEAGTWTLVWITLALAFSAFLWFYGDLVHGIHNFEDLQAVASRYATHLKLNPNDFEGSLQHYRHYMTISYISGYLIEKTLSVDNLFVMMMIFTSFGVKNTEYQHVLNWGLLSCVSCLSLLVQLSFSVLIGCCWSSESYWFTAHIRCTAIATKRKQWTWSIILWYVSCRSISMFTLVLTAITFLFVR